ncbi:MAG: virB4 [Rickettsiales bacterium]|jgi:type IV secretion system protein VirB4|nr:virB4 [Rickettsiales bacterium]
MKFKFTKRRTRHENVANREVSAAEFIPYKAHWNKNTIITHSNWLIQVIKINGFAFETADDEDIDIRKNIRNTLWKGMASGSFSLAFHTIRRKKEAYDKNNLISPMKNMFAKAMDEEWRLRHHADSTFVNEHYVTIIRKQDTQGVAKVEHLLKKIRQKADNKAWELEMRESAQDLEEMVGRVMMTLRDYSPRILGIREKGGIAHSEILEFLGMLVNGGVAQPMLIPAMPISNYLAHQRLFFGQRSIEIRGAMGSRYAGILSVKEYGPRTNASMMDGFLQMPFELIMSQTFGFINRTVAIQKMQLQQNRMIQAEDKAVSQIQEISEALDMAMSGSIGFGHHHMTVMCVEDSPKALENALALAAVELSNGGGITVREQVNLEPAYWAQLPCNEDYVVRKATINTLNLSSFASFHNYPVGKEKGNHWGDAVTVFDTTSGTPYYFNFHARDVGHTTIIGPTGAGKTVLMNFLCAQSQKFHCRMFFFDKDRGAEIFLRAIDGNYTMIDPGANCGFNPLQLDQSSENRNFLIEWMKALVTVNGELISAEDQMLIAQAVDGNFKLDKKDRVLRNVVPFLGLSGPGTLAGRMEMWHGRGSHAGVFDNQVDVLDFSKNLTFGFEMADLLKDPAALGPVLLYLFHRINLALDGTPTMIVLDEAWALIDNPIFAPKIKDWLKVLRKLNAMVIFATQSVEDASKSAISDTLIQQTGTQIFLPNLKATSVYKDAFMLSQREYTLIKTTDPGSRFFLIKQGSDAVVARIDLSGMNDVINVLSGRADTVLLLDKIREEVGDAPENWLPIFLERVKEL